MVTVTIPELKDADGLTGRELLVVAQGENDRKTSLESVIDALAKPGLAAETAERQGADAVLQSNINAESQTRQNADATLQSNITAEASARQQGDMDTLAGAKEYADELSLATQTWLPAVQAKSGLPTGGLNKKVNYLCRVISDSNPANNGVYQAIAGWTSSPAWTYFSDNADWIDPIELEEAISEHNENPVSHEDIRQGLAEEAEAREAAIAEHDESASAWTLPR
jgi:hypothetical protein